MERTPVKAQKTYIDLKHISDLTSTVLCLRSEEIDAISYDFMPFLDISGHF